MASTNKIKVALFTIISLVIFGWAISGTVSKATGDSIDGEQKSPDLIANANPDDYVGSDSCKDCHEAQFKNFADTKHSKLKDVAGWKDKVQGCESCHGPGRKHLEDATDPKNIISFKGKSSKAISETCLTCHSGRETHNNFRRGEHWRNNVGCTDCHSTHGPAPENSGVDSGAFIGRSFKGEPPPAMLKSNEQQLCITCHSEVKSHFNKPFRHKVMEGVMKCSDCHNAHGGFESKQAKLGFGADASCVKCHADKQGPFVFEHAPVKVEGCSACHTPHGSANPRLLKRPQVRQLCIECHSGITEQLSDGPTAGPHDQKTLLQRNCTACHSMIHGSNTSNVFFK
ncbi:MAG: DmsE family decaheme c-type cytochrome [Pyrinomonadaceae bacterium]